MPTTTCPSADRLVAFQTGKLNHIELNAVATHLERCATCLTVLERVSTMKDSLVLELRQGQTRDGFSAEADCRRALANAVALRGDATATLDDTAEGNPHMDLTATTLGKYQLLEKIGQGGMGTVYKAFHTLLKRVVAIKVLPPNRLRNPQAVSRFRREIEAAGRLDHPHIVRTSDADAADGQHFLVMEWLAGQDLSKWVRERGPLSIAEACDFIRQAALGLACAHEHGMVHRDVKPSNLLVTQQTNGTSLVKVLDLGLALLHSNDAGGEELTSADRVMGTYDYIAPEQAMNAHEVDARADIYGLGCTLYFVLTGRAPFQGQTETQKLLSHQHAQPISVAQYRSDAPKQIIAVLNKMMAKEPKDRYASMSEVANTLQRADTRPDSMAAPRTDNRIRLGAIIFASMTAFGLIVVGVFALYSQLMVRLQGNTEMIDNQPSRDVLVDAKKDVNSTPNAVKATLDSELAIGETKRFLGHTSEVRCLAMSPDGQAFFSGSYNEPWLWDINHSAERIRLGDMLGWVHGGTFSHDGAYLGAGGQGGVAVVWDAKTGKKTHQIAKFASGPPMERFAADPAQSLIYYANQGGVRVYDLESKKDLPKRFQGNQVRISKDGKRVLTSDGNLLYLWDADTGAELSRIKLPGHIFCIDITPNGRRALAGVGTNILVYDLDARTALPKLEGSQGKVQAIAVAPDGTRALSGGSDNKVRLWDLDSAKELQCFEGHTAAVLSIAFTPDGRRALTGSEDKTIRLWQLPTPTLAKVESKKQIPPPAKWTGPLHLDMVSKLDIRSRLEPRDIGLSQSQASVISQLLFSRTDTIEFRKGDRGKLGLGRICLDQGNGVYLFIPISQIAQIEGTDKQHVATLTDGTTQRGRLLSAVTGKDGKSHQLSDMKSITVLCESPELPSETKSPNANIRVGGSEYSLSAYAFQSGRQPFGHKVQMIIGNETLEPTLTDFDKVTLTPSADGKWRIVLTAPSGKESAGILEVASGSGPRWYLLGDTRNDWLILVAYFNGNSGFHLVKSKSTASLPLIAEHEDSVTHLAISRDGTRMLSYTSAANLAFWDLEQHTGEVKLRWKRKASNIRGIALDPAGTRTMLAIGGSSYLYQADPQTGDISEWRKGRHDGATGLLFTEDGRRYLMADFYGSISVRDAVEGEVLRKFDGHANGNSVRPAPLIALSRDGERVLSSGDDHVVRLWDATNAAELSKFPFPAAKKRVIALSPNGRHALISQDNSILLYNLSAGNSPTVLQGHKDRISALAFDSAGVWCVSASQDKTLRVWSIATGKTLHVLEGHSDDVSSVAVTADGRVVSASRDKTIRVWTLPK